MQKKVEKSETRTRDVKHFSHMLYLLDHNYYKTQSYKLDT